MDQAQDHLSLSTAKHTIASAGTCGLIVATLAGATTLVSGLAEVVPAIRSPEGGGMGALMFLWAVVALVIGVVMAVFLTQASLAFRTATLTGTTDPQQLSRGLRKLRSFFKTMGILFVTAVGAAVIGFLAAGGV